MPDPAPPPSCWLGLRCLLRMCPCRHYEDAGGCGGQCINCGKIVGYVTRAEIRTYLDANKPRLDGGTQSGPLRIKPDA